MPDSLNKTINLFRAGYSYVRSSVSGSVDIKGLPVSVSAELTNNCNLACPHCSSGSGLMQRARGYMNPDLFRKVMKELRQSLINVNLYFQGEPMLHPMFFSFIGYCSGANTVVSTNGHFLSAGNAEKIVTSGLSKLIISLDGIGQDIYSTYRINGNAEKVIAGIRNVAVARDKFKSSLKIEIQCLVNRFNEHEVPAIRELARETHCKLKLKSMQIIDKAMISNWLPSDKRFRRYQLEGDTFMLKSSLPNHCARVWFNPVITWDGKVVPCCFDKDAEFVMGDLNNDTFSDIWDGPKYRMFRKSILTGRDMIDMCRNCTSGLKEAKY
jgi:radical SAM protein with 4Fe4S-binding SPASM domain